MRWAARWNTVLSLSKSVSLTALMDPLKPPTDPDLPSILEEVESATILGLEFVRRGARPLAYIKRILQRSAACTRRLLSLTLEGQLRLDTLIFIYKSKPYHSTHTPCPSPLPTPTHLPAYNRPTTILPEAYYHYLKTLLAT